MDELRETIAKAVRMQAKTTGAAVLIPIIETPEGPQVLLELRAYDLDIQPGEVCLPGGHIEDGESPLEAAVRETCEELLVEPAQIEILGELGSMAGPGNRPLHVAIGILHGYKGTFSPAEVDHTFCIPLQWLIEQDPELFEVSMEPRYPVDFPWDLVPGGRNYPWRSQVNRVPFYRESQPIVWGATARVLLHFSQLMRRAMECQ